MNGMAFFVYVFPFLLGAVLRAMFLKWKRGCLLSCVFALIAVIVWIRTKSLVDHGMEGTLLLWALMAIELTVGSCVVGGLSLLLKKTRCRKDPDLP